MSAAQVAEVTGLSAATAHRILKTLQSQAYLEQDPQTRAYSLGIGILKLASNIADRHNEVAILASTMNRIREITGETISLHSGRHRQDLRRQVAACERPYAALVNIRSFVQSQDLIQIKRG